MRLSASWRLALERRERLCWPAQQTIVLSGAGLGYSHLVAGRGGVLPLPPPSPRRGVEGRGSDSQLFIGHNITTTLQELILLHSPRQNSGCPAAGSRDCATAAATAGCACAASAASPAWSTGEVTPSPRPCSDEDTGQERRGPQQVRPPLLRPRLLLPLRARPAAQERGQGQVQHRGETPSRGLLRDKVCMYLFTRRVPGQHLRGRGGGGVLPAVRAVPGGGGDTGQAAGSLDTANTLRHISFLLSQCPYNTYNLSRYCHHLPFRLICVNICSYNF